MKKTKEKKMEEEIKAMMRDEWKDFVDKSGCLNLTNMCEFVEQFFPDCNLDNEHDLVWQCGFEIHEELEEKGLIND